MKRLLEFPLEDGCTILVEVNEAELEGGIVQAGRTSEMITKANQTFERAIDVVRPAADSIVKKLRDLPDQPDEIKVEFGLKVNAEAQAFVAAVVVDANYKVTLKWKNL